MKNILLINGPNLNLLGTREPQIYGADTLADVERRLIESAAGRGVAVQCFQSNSEGGLVDRIHAARDEGVDAVIINAGPAALSPLTVAPGPIANAKSPCALALSPMAIELLDGLASEFSTFASLPMAMELRCAAWALTPAASASVPVAPSLSRLLPAPASVLLTL